MTTPATDQTSTSEQPATTIDPATAQKYAKVKQWKKDNYEKNRRIREAVKAHQPPPPWEREEMRIPEVPLWVKHMYNIDIGLTTVKRWIVKGYAAKDMPGQRVYLKTVQRLKKGFIKAADIKAFLEAT